MSNPERYVSIHPRKLEFGPKRARFYHIDDIVKSAPYDLPAGRLDRMTRIDLVYRTMCAMLFNFVPTSGHPGGSVSSGRIVESLLYNTMTYDMADPDATDADILVYAAGHKAMGLYAMWALRNELVRIGGADLLPSTAMQLRLEDLLGFRRNPTNETTLFNELKSKALDGHPTPGTPFVKIATGPSGVGVPASLGLATAALDSYGASSPKIHILEGEGGMTPGRVHEALATAASACLNNTILHVDWNQASIDSDKVCRENDEPGDYVQWDPIELCYCHDWNVIYVEDGTDFQKILAAQEFVLAFETTQPTAIVYRTTKGWRYGIEGKKSHGAGHKFCSEGYYEVCRPFEEAFGVQVPRFSGDPTPQNVEKTYYDTLMTVRRALEAAAELPELATENVRAAKERLRANPPKLRPGGPALKKLYSDPAILNPEVTPDELRLQPGDKVTLRAVLGDTLNYLNRKADGAFLGTAADLFGSTSVVNLNKGFDEGLYNSVSNPKTRLVAVGGICEDAMGAFMSGVSAYGNHIGVSSSYGAFIGPLEHIAARVHGIGQQAKREHGPYNTWIMVNAHAGAKTGEDGPTHADPQVLQLLQENFPKGILITLTPWDSQEIWPLMAVALKERPAVLCPFVTRPADVIVDRNEFGLPPAATATKGVYAIRRADPGEKRSGTLVLQGNAVATIFVQEVLKTLDEKGLNLNVYYVASAELFNRLSPEEREEIFPESLRAEAMGITDFTLPTMYRWVRSNVGLERTLHPFHDGHYLGSGQAKKVLQEAGIHAAGQLKAILSYARAMENR